MNPEKKAKAKAQRHKNNDRFIRVSENAKIEKFKEMGEKVKNGEVVWSYYAIDGKVGYHFYRKK